MSDRNARPSVLASESSGNMGNRIQQKRNVPKCIPEQGGPHGYDAGKKVLGRKRNVVVDTLGLVWALVVTPADGQDRDGAKLAFEAFHESVKFPKII